MDDYQVIIKPLVTEKGTHQAQRLNAYAFEVHVDANKTQIRQAVERIYGVKVIDVRTATRRGKQRRRGRVRGYTRQWKKAVVVLPPEHHIDLF